MGRDIPRFLIGDDQRLAQVVTNLLSNAVKFTPEKGSIRLEARLVKQEGRRRTLQFSISDTGIGISKEQQARLFDPFTQADSGISRRFGGTGLGLVISKRIVEKMGGRIWIESEPGRGAVFSFTVELEAGGTEALLSAAGWEAPTDFGQSAGSDGPGTEAPSPLWRKTKKFPEPFAGRRILLVEDMEINREVVLALFEPARMIFECAENGAEAVRLYRESPEGYDLIFMDIHMPEMDGYEATRRIRAMEEPGKRVPIVAMTANVFREDIEKCLRAGMDDHVGKPLDPEEVTGKLQKYLSLFQTN
jgi:CheY-like chemotaxis protein/anti-sigma regulatory factor (Ser/Thr protein kinase)